VERPSLDYQHAFDLCAVEVHRHSGAVAVFASSPFHARELLKRLNGSATALVPTGTWRSSAGDSDQWLGPEVRVPAVRTLEAIEPPLQTIVWAEPEMETGQQVMRRIGHLLRADARLCVVVSDWLAAFLPEWRGQKGQPARRPAGLRRTYTWLRQAGFEVEQVSAFHGPQSIAWGYASRFMLRLGRGDWADRCHFQMRAQYTVYGWQGLLSPVSVVVAKRP
jgi:hypothetical protein